MLDKNEDENLRPFLGMSIDKIETKNIIVILQTIDYLELYEEDFRNELYKLLDKFGVDYERNR